MSACVLPLFAFFVAYGTNFARVAHNIALHIFATTTQTKRNLNNQRYSAVRFLSRVCLLGGGGGWLSKNFAVKHRNNRLHVERGRTALRCRFSTSCRRILRISRCLDKKSKQAGVMYWRCLRTSVEPWCVQLSKQCLAAPAHQNCRFLILKKI